MFKFWKITIFGFFFILIVMIWIFLIGFSSNQPGSFFNKEHNAIWIGHEWVGEQKSDQEIQELISVLHAHQIDTVFVHVGPLNKEGTIDPKSYEYSLDFMDSVRKFDDSIQYQAWLGQIRNKIDLADPEVRHNIANLSMMLADLVDFDGIHFDIEPVWDGDAEFILLLEEVRGAISDEKIISVALAELIPGSILWLTEHIHTFENYNSEVNYKNVAQYADQVVAMIYDTSIQNEWFYRWFVNEQTIRITDLLDGTEVFIGVPAYEYTEDDITDLEGVDSLADITWFNSEVENIENGLRGIVKGLNNFRSNEDNFAGVAIYSYWEMSDEEWMVYDELWLK